MYSLAYQSFPPPTLSRPSATFSIREKFDLLAPKLVSIQMDFSVYSIFSMFSYEYNSIKDKEKSLKLH